MDSDDVDMTAAGSNGEHSTKDLSESSEMEVLPLEESEETPNGTSNVVPRPSTPEEEKNILKELESKANLDGFKEGATWYVISQRWFKKWKEFTSYDPSSYYIHSSSDPGPIDNHNLLEGDAEGENRRIMKSCMESYDFMFISEEMWNTLHSWYGGGPTLPRKVIKTAYSSLVVEVRPLSLKVCKSSDSSNYVTAFFSKADTVGTFKTRMCEVFGLDPKEVRVWDYHGHKHYKLLDDMNVKLESAQIMDGQPMMIEEKENGKFQETAKTSLYSSPYSTYSSGPVDPGTVGLMNLGNTCFMNSSLQCLSNTVPLTQFFTKKEEYEPQINRDNALGMKGEIAEAYAELVQKIWEGSSSSVAPRDFKWKLERFAPQFAGYQQHDSQELLAFLLDGLHEDMNRIKKKPYTENPEVDGRPQEEVAREAWEKHKSRNDSIIVDWFQGQLRSTLICPKCDKVSITFDPFMYLSLPLPMKTTRTIYVTMFFLDPSRKPRKYGCEVEIDSSVKSLKVVLGKLSGVNPEHIVITDVFSNRFYKLLQDKESVDGIQDRDDSRAFEILESTEEQEVIRLPLLQSLVEEKRPIYSYGSSVSLLGHPLIISVPKGLTYSQLYDAVFENVRRYLKIPASAPIIRTTDQLKEFPDVEENDSDSSDDDQGLKESKKPRTDQPLFTIVRSDSHGTSKEDLNEDGPLDLDDEEYICLRWKRSIANEDIEEDESCEKKPEETANQISLKTCLELFTMKEQLGPNDPWYCSSCKEFQEATKKFDLWSLPPILVVHLKRFRYKTRTWREKIETFVDYPIEGLDLSEYVQGPKGANYVYDLYAVSNHYGSLGGGHYTAFAKNKNNNKWYKFDDSSGISPNILVTTVSPTDAAHVKTSFAYVLFYQRRDTRDTTAAAPASISEDDATQEME